MLAKRLLYASRTKGRLRTKKTRSFDFNFKRTQNDLTVNYTNETYAVANHIVFYYLQKFLVLRIQV